MNAHESQLVRGEDVMEYTRYAEAPSCIYRVVGDVWIEYSDIETSLNWLTVGYTESDCHYQISFPRISAKEAGEFQLEWRLERALAPTRPVIDAAVRVAQKALGYTVQ